jgi:Nucleoside-diphosphate-sugar epimerases
MKYKMDYWNDIERVIKYIPDIEKLKNSRIMIVGASGLIGSSIFDLLYYLNHFCGYHIQVILTGRSFERISNRFGELLLDFPYEFQEFDGLKDLVINIKADYILYCAGNASPDFYVTHPVETMMVNLSGLYTMLNCAKNNGTKRLLYVSSSEVYGINNTGGYFRENDLGYVDVLNPRACYPSAKRAAETLCTSFYNEYKIDTVIVRPGHIYGPGIIGTDQKASSQFMRKAINHEDIILKSKGEQQRSYCYSLDCASAILTVLLCGKRLNAYNISNKKSIISIYDLAKEFATVAGVKVIFEDSCELKGKEHNPMSISALNSDKLESLGWKASFDIQEGIKKTLFYFES